MINYFLQQQQNLTPEIKSIVHKSFSKNRKYQPFHIDCPTTRKKICYCINNPVLNVQVQPKVKEQMWKKYEEADDFYMGIQAKNKELADQHFSKIKTKIQCLSRREVASFVRSIKKQKNLMGQIIEY